MSKTVSLNSKVKIKCNGTVKTYQLVRSSDVDSSFSKISDVSPLGKLLLGSKVKDMIKVKTPNGITEYEVVSIKTLYIYQ